MAGHSFGGYLCGNYSLTHHKHIKKLLLLSPVGYSPGILGGKEMTEEQLRAVQEGVFDDHPAWFTHLARFVWSQKMSPFDISRFGGRKTAYFFLRGYVERDWMPSGTVKPEHAEDLLDYMHQIFQRDGTTEYAPTMTFNHQLDAYHPLGV